MSLPFVSLRIEVRGISLYTQPDRSNVAHFLGQIVFAKSVRYYVRWSCKLGDGDAVADRANSRVVNHRSAASTYAADTNSSQGPYLSSRPWLNGMFCMGAT